MDNKKREGKKSNEKKTDTGKVKINKLYEFSEKKGFEECRNSFNVRRIMRFLFTLNTLQLTT